MSDKVMTLSEILFSFAKKIILTSVEGATEN